MFSKIAFFTVIYDGIENDYVEDYFYSLSQQTIKEFDVFLLNDGYKNLDYFLKKYKSLNIVELKLEGTPAKIREAGLNYLIDNEYNVVIFGDFDDFIDKNRIEKSSALLEKFDIVVNDFDVVDEKSQLIEKGYLSNRIKNKTVLGFKDIKDKNFFGMSNSALKINNLKKLLFPENIIAVDWYLFSLLLIYNKSAVFTNETKTFYRQHKNNTIGINALDEYKIKKSIKTKMLQYKYLKNIDNSFEKSFEHFNKLYNSIEKSDSKIIEYYNNKIKDLKKIKSVWWEDII